MAKPKAVWLAMTNDHYMLFRGAKKPKWVKRYSIFRETSPTTYLTAFCATKFESVTGYRLEPGTCRRVMVSVEEV